MRGKIQGKMIIKWLLVIGFIGFGTGILSFFFLNGLVIVTKLRELNQWLILGLPLIGMLFTWLYQTYGGVAHQGNNLVIDRANGKSPKVPLILIPLTLFGTITSHLFGASVGREGTAVQMGGSLSEGVASLFKLDERQIPLAIICGMSGGFSSVFGTPFAGAIFAVEVLVIGKIRWAAMIPALMTALIANQTTNFLGVTHSHYPHINAQAFDGLLVLKVIAATVLFGGVSSLFSWAIPKIKETYKNLIPSAIYRSGFGGCVILLLVLLFGTTRYLGLSLTLITDAFNGNQEWFDFINKLIFTVFSLGAGFQGGEVTPLFEIGGTLGANLADILNVSVPLLGALGFIGVFAGATNTPIACTVMGMELFGAQIGPWLLLASMGSYYFSTSRGIYAQQSCQNKKLNFKKMMIYLNHKKKAN